MNGAVGWRRRAALAALPVLLGCGSAEPARDVEQQQQGPGTNMDAVYLVPSEDAEAARAAMLFSDPDAWTVDVVDGDAVLTLKGGSEYEPPVRSPYNIGLIGAFAFGDFVLDAELQQTGREYGHRDLCVFFGHQGPDRFYYVHLATQADQNAHNVFLVDRAARRPIATATTGGIDWGATDAWHRLRIARRGASIRVFFDDMATPIMEAEDATFPIGRIGFGSFDDEGRFRRIQVQGDPRPAPEGAPFAR